jgi:alkylation response protein AidB-like acyl-CoA dehydrogenase
VALAITEDHLALARVARSVVRDRAVLAAARAAVDDESGKPAPFWKDVVSAGWTGLHVPEEFGGQGFGLAELAVVTEELGRAVAPGPFLPTVLAAAVISEAGTDEQRQRWLPGLCSGSAIAAVGVGGSARCTAHGLSGDAGVVLGALDADVLLLADGPDLIVVEPGAALRVEASGAVDPTRPVARVRCESAPVVDLLPGATRIARRVGLILAAAEAVGGMHACVEMTVAYATQREQFGRPIGSFQAVKHHCADMLLDAELASAATWDATRPVADLDEADLVAAMAAACALPAYLRVAELAIQVHGGIGYTWEHDAHLYLRRAAALAAVFEASEPPTQRVAAMRGNGMRRGRSLDLPPEAERYRHDARAFVEEYSRTPEEQRPSFFARSGYLLPHWPRPYGRAAGPVEQLVIEEELSATERPGLGLGEWILPTLLQHGSAEQQDRLLWSSLEGRLRWCQLFSEPGAGSDAAAISTRARRTDGGWLISGQKVWTSDARNCHRGLATVRTDPDASKHRGITAMIIDLHAPGVEVRPLTEITGEALFNEVFFDDVFVPDVDVVGEVNDGWRVARATLGNERISIGAGSVTMQADSLLGLLDRHRPDDVGSAREVGALLVEAHALKMLNLRHAARAVAGTEPGVEGSLAKLFGAEHAQRVVDLGMRIAGGAALIGREPALVHDFFFSRCLTIAGGTSEVLRNQIAERILGLPRDPR